MIPKVIHYCWFGGKPLPQSAIKCINSWKKFLPDYEIKEWNEQNFDVNMCPYTKEAYERNLYAFVSDVARFYILYKEGGVYFDTDVEVIRSMDDIIAKGAFMGIEDYNFLGTHCPQINPGLGMGAEKGNVFVNKMLEHYMTAILLDKSTGTLAGGTVVGHTTRMLLEAKMKKDEGVQKVADFILYPPDYFNPFNDATGRLTKTTNTRSIHWYSKTWIDKPLIYYHITRFFHRIFGIKSMEKLKCFFHK